MHGYLYSCMAAPVGSCWAIGQPVWAMPLKTRWLSGG